METHENTTASGNAERASSVQKLTRIKGIKQKTAEALYEIGIHSYAGLVQFLSRRTAGQVSQEISKHGGNLPPGFINKDSWIRQARELIQQEKTPPAKPNVETDTSDQSGETPASQETPVHDVEFSVFFDVMKDDAGNPILRTLVYKAENAGHEEPFFGKETAPWVNWMLEQANLPAAVVTIPTQAEKTEETSANQAAIGAWPTPGQPLDIRLEIGNLTISVLEPASEIPDKRLAAELTFRLAGNDSKALVAQSLPFRVEIYTIDLDEGIPQRVASGEGQLEPHQFEYTCQLEFGIPSVGRYRYHSLVHLLPFGELMALRWGPTMKVIP